MKKQIEAELAIELSKARWDQPEIERIHELLTQNIDWQLYQKICLSNRIHAINFISIKKLKLSETIPVETLTFLKDHHTKIERENNKRIEHAVEFIKIFNQENIPFALLKGIGLAETVYGDYSYKRMNDVDLLLQYKDIARAEKIYTDLNFFSVKEPTSGESKDNEHNKRAFVAPVYISRDLKCVVGTQWGIKMPILPFNFDYQSMLRNSIKIDYHGTSAYVLCHEDNLLHLCVHLSLFKTTIRDMMDIFNLIRHPNAIDWEKFYASVIQSNALDKVYFALALSQSFVFNSEVEKFLQRLTPRASRFFVNQVKHRVFNFETLLNSNIDYIKVLETAFTEFSMAQFCHTKFRAMMKIYQALLLPSEKHMNMLNCEENLVGLKKWKYRISTPFLITRILADEEIGRSTVALFIIKTFVDLAVSIVKTPYLYFTVEDERDDFAKKVGISTEQLNWLLTHFK